MGIEKLDSRGLIVAICGIDGAGKSSIHAALQESSIAKNAEYYSFSERGNVLALDAAGTLQRDCSHYHDAECWAYCFDFLRYYQAQIVPRLEEASVLVSDRWAQCITAYCSSHLVRSEVGNVLAPIVIPDLILYVDIEPHIAHMRALERGRERFGKPLEQLALYREGYRKVLAPLSNRVLEIRNNNLETSVQAAAAAINRLLGAP